MISLERWSRPTRWIPALVLVVASSCGGWLLASLREPTYVATATLAVDRAPFGSLGLVFSEPELGAMAASAEGKALRSQTAAKVGVAPGELSIDAAFDSSGSVLRLETKALSPDVAVTAAVVAAEIFVSERDRLHGEVVERASAQATLLFDYYDGAFADRVARLRDLQTAGLTAEAAGANRMMWHTSNRRSRYQGSISDLRTDAATIDRRIDVLALPAEAREESPSPWSFVLGGSLIAIGLLAAAGAGWRRWGPIDLLADLEPLVAPSPVIAVVRSGSRAADVDGGGIRFVRNVVVRGYEDDGVRTLAFVGVGDTDDDTRRCADATAAAVSAGGMPATSHRATAEMMESLDFGGDAAAQWVNEFTASKGVVIISAPAVTSYLESMLLARAADATVLVVRMGQTRPSDVAVARNCLRIAGIDPAGVIVTCAPRLDPDGHSQ